MYSGLTLVHHDLSCMGLASTNSFNTSTLPFMTARWSGFLPSLLRARHMSESIDINACTTSMCPFADAKCRASVVKRPKLQQDLDLFCHKFFMPTQCSHMQRDSHRSSQRELERMEQRLHEAAIKGNATLLHQILREDPIEWTLVGLVGVLCMWLHCVGMQAL